MSKPVKQLMRKELAARLEGVTSLALVSLAGVDAIATNEIRGRLLAKDIRVRVVKNSIARQAFQEADLGAAADLLDGPCAVVYGGDNVVSVVRELLAIGKEAPNLKVKGALLEGDAFGPDRIDELSKFPTREEAIGRIVACATSAGRKLAGCVTAPASKIAGILKVIEDKLGDGGEDSVEAA